MAQHWHPLYLACVGCDMTLAPYDADDQKVLAISCPNCLASAPVLHVDGKIISYPQSIYRVLLPVIFGLDPNSEKPHLEYYLGYRQTGTICGQTVNELTARGLTSQTGQVLFECTSDKHPARWTATRGPVYQVMPVFVNWDGTPGPVQDELLVEDVGSGGVVDVTPTEPTTKK